MTKHKQCPLPFKQLYLHSSGQVYPCGFLQNNILLGDVTESSLNDIWSGQRAQEFRERHREGNEEFCKKNQKKYNCHLLHSNLRQDQEPNGPDSIKRLDFMIDSACNIKCVMCTNIYEKRGGFKRNEFWQELKEKVVPSLDELEIIGGEPFILDDTYRLLDILIRNNPNCRIQGTTNAFFDVHKRFLNYFRDANFYSLAISIDSLDPVTFAKIRDGANLDLVLKNTETIIEQNQCKEGPSILTINMVVQQENAHEVVEMAKFCNDIGVKFYPILLHAPEEFSLFNWPGSQITKLSQQLIENLHVHPRITDLIFKIFKNSNAETKIELTPLIETINHNHKVNHGA